MVKHVFRLLNKFFNKFNGGAAAENLKVQDDRKQPCQSVQADQNAFLEIDRLKNEVRTLELTVQSNQIYHHEINGLNSEIKALELLIGQLIVERERGRCWHKPRLKTIAKMHLQTEKLLKNDRWIREGRSLARFISTCKDNDVGVAQELLSPCLLKLLH